MLVVAVTFILIVLGSFEFFAAWKFFFHTETSINENPLLSTNFMNEDVKTLFVCYIITLGIFRLSFALGNKDFPSWVGLVGTHFIEAILWWRLIFVQKLSEATNLLDIAKEIILLKLNGSIVIALLLLGVPLLILLFLIMGVNFYTKSQKAGKMD